jgi:Fur family zinc uptake transcriptional regulator
LKTRGEKLQEEILTIMHDGALPLSAYKILEALKVAYPKIAPPTVYRALAALTKRDAVHRLETLNAYIPCQCGEDHQQSILSVCNDCGTVDESVEPDVFSELNASLTKVGFSAQRHIIEVHGTCADCSEDEQDRGKK